MFASFKLNYLFLLHFVASQDLKWFQKDTHTHTHTHTHTERERERERIQQDEKQMRKIEQRVKQESGMREDIAASVNVFYSF
jgi:hypothetical protein